MNDRCANYLRDENKEMPAVIKGGEHEVKFIEILIKHKEASAHAMEITSRLCPDWKTTCNLHEIRRL